MAKQKREARDNCLTAQALQVSTSQLSVSSADAHLVRRKRDARMPDVLAHSYGSAQMAVLEAERNTAGRQRSVSWNDVAHGVQPGWQPFPQRLSKPSSTNAETSVDQDIAHLRRHHRTTADSETHSFVDALAWAPPSQSMRSSSSRLLPCSVADSNSTSGSENRPLCLAPLVPLAPIAIAESKSATPDRPQQTRSDTPTRRRAHLSQQLHLQLDSRICPLLLDVTLARWGVAQEVSALQLGLASSSRTNNLAATSSVGSVAGTSPPRLMRQSASVPSLHALLDTAVPSVASQQPPPQQTTAADSRSPQLSHHDHRIRKGTQLPCSRQPQLLDSQISPRHLKAENTTKSMAEPREPRSQTMQGSSPQGLLVLDDHVVPGPTTAESSSLLSGTQHTPSGIFGGTNQVPRHRDAAPAVDMPLPPAAAPLTHFDRSQAAAPGRKTVGMAGIAIVPQAQFSSQSLAIPAATWLDSQEALVTKAKTIFDVVDHEEHPASTLFEPLPTRKTIFDADHDFHPV